ncbi:unnamed protein product [Calypogeia fissa]
MEGGHHVQMSMKMGASLSESAATLLQFALLPIAKVFVMCALGLLMATSYIGILTASARMQLTKLVFSLFLPCLIFTQLGAVVTVEKIFQWWFIPVNVILASLVGCTIGYIVALIVKPPPRFFNFTVVMIGIGNIGNIPLVIIGAICRDSSNPFGDPAACNSNGVAYISFGQWVGAVIVYTFVYRMLAPPGPGLDDIESINGGDAYKKPISYDTDESGSYAPLAVVEDNGGTYGSLAVVEDNGDLRPLLGNVKNKCEVKDWVTSCLASVRIQDIFQPPVVASLLALLIGATPFFRGLFFVENSVFFFLTDSLNIMGGAMIPCIMLALGGNLIGGAGSSELGLRTTIAITATRLLVIPMGGLTIVTLADKLGFLPPDDLMFRFVLLIQHTMPSSILAGAVANLRGHAVKEASAVLFYEHVFAILSMAGWLILYVNYLF